MRRRFWIVLLVLIVAVLLVSPSFMLQQGRLDMGVEPTRQAIEATNEEIYRQITLTVIRKTGMPPASTPLTRDADNVRVSAQGETGPTPMIVRNAELSLVVADVRAALDDIMTMTGQMGGWVVSSEMRRLAWATSDEMVMASIVIRVPAEQLDSVLEAIRRGAITIAGETITGQDVSEEYTDLSSTLRNLEAAEAQLQEIMDNAAETSDVLDVFSELRRVRGEIETARGRMQYLEQVAAFSSIRVTLNPEPMARTPVPAWDLMPEIQRAVVGLEYALQGLVTLLIWLIVLVLPLAVVVGVPGIVLLRVWRRLVRKVGSREKDKEPDLDATG